MIAAAGLVAMASTGAMAQSVTFTLLDPFQAVPATGGTLSFNASVFAPATNTMSEDLNGITSNISPANGFDFDSDPFLTAFPFSLAPGESYSGLLFRLTVPAGSAVGPYLGSVALIGGPNNTQLGSQAFSIAVSPAVPLPTSSVPEPAAWGMMVLGMGAVGFAMRRRRTGTTRVSYAV